MPFPTDFLVPALRALDVAGAEPGVPHGPPRRSRYRPRTPTKPPLATPPFIVESPARTTGPAPIAPQAGPAPTAPQVGPAMQGEGIDPDLLSASIGLNGYDDDMAVYQMQMKRANTLRNTATPEMRGNGRVIVAANPFEHVSTVMDRVQGHRDRKGLDAEMAKSREARKAGIARIQRAIAKKYGLADLEEPEIPSGLPGAL